MFESTTSAANGHDCSNLFYCFKKMENLHYVLQVLKHNSIFSQKHQTLQSIVPISTLSLIQSNSSSEAFSKFYGILIIPRAQKQF